ncbi:MAG: CinA domain protein [Pedobacter sp.]|jgi:nicotinamide-nucleotide amidase|nr:CinA domain protein [Pedobacter sp.]
MPSKQVEDCCTFLMENELSVAFAESATVGQFSAEFGLTDVAGKVLKGGIVCYDASVKQQLLNVDDELLEEYTPESAEVTKAAAYGLRKLLPADIHIAITGLTCEGGSESAEKPVGTMFIHCISDRVEFSDRTVFTGNKAEIILQCIDHTCDLLIKKLGA